MLSFSVSVSLQMMSPHSGDILSRVILQSDTFLSVSYHPLTADQAGRMAGRLQAQLGCSEDMDLVTCLADKDTEDVMSSALNVSIETYTYGWEAFYMRQHL